MKDVRVILGKAFKALTDIAENHDLKSDKLDEGGLISLCLDLAKLEELVGEAMRRAAGHRVLTLYAIGKETAVGEYDGFTYGPVEDRQEMLDSYAFEDGDCLVKITTGGGDVVNFVTESIYLDGEWNDTEDEEDAELAADTA